MSKASKLYFETKTIRDKAYVHGQGDSSNANRIQALNHLLGMVPGYIERLDTAAAVMEAELHLNDFIEHIREMWGVDAEKNEIHNN